MPSEAELQELLDSLDENHNALLELRNDLVGLNDDLIQLERNLEAERHGKASPALRRQRLHVVEGGEHDA